jgi:hypothetical protein
MQVLLCGPLPQPTTYTPASKTHNCLLKQLHQLMAFLFNPIKIHFFESPVTATATTVVCQCWQRCF